MSLPVLAGRPALQPLLAQAAGQIGDCVTRYELLDAVARLGAKGRTTGRAHGGLLVDGMPYGAGRATPA